MTSTMLAAALELVVSGWRVHPCAPSGPRAKAPLLEHGHLQASADPAVITSWWTNWPTAMIGVPVPDNLLVLDIDPRNGGSLELLQKVVGELPATLTTWSGREDGGRHLWFRRPTGEFVSTGLPTGVDLKANGYVIVPPSIHPATGRAYRWEQAPFAALPAAAREALRPHRKPAPRSGSQLPQGRRAEALLRSVEQAPEGRRNDILFWAACRAVQERHGPELFLQMYTAAVNVGLDGREAARAIESAQRREAS